MNFRPRGINLLSSIMDNIHYTLDFGFSIAARINVEGDSLYIK